MIFDTVIPAISHPTPKIAKPRPAYATCDCTSPPKGTQIVASPKSVETAHHFRIAPLNIRIVEVRPVKRIPNLSRMIPPKKSSRRYTFIKPYAPENHPYSLDVHPRPRPFSAPFEAVSSGSSGDITSQKK